MGRNTFPERPIFKLHASLCVLKVALKWILLDQNCPLPCSPGMLQIKLLCIFLLSWNHKWPHLNSFTQKCTFQVAQICTKYFLWDKWTFIFSYPIIKIKTQEHLETVNASTNGGDVVILKLKRCLRPSAPFNSCPTHFEITRGICNDFFITLFLLSESWRLAFSSHWEQNQTPIRSCITWEHHGNLTL